jgi:hypothetical protein
MAEEQKAKDLIDRLADEVPSLMSQGNQERAITICLAEVPATKKEALKAKHAETVGKALCSVNDSTMKKIIADLSDDEKANAMKYTYKAMGQAGKDQCPTLLKWHSNLLADGGLGLIARAMVDRKV